MKKLIALFLVLIMVLSLSACQGKPSAEERNAAKEIIGKLDTVFTAHQSANEDVLTANSLSSSTGYATKVSDLTSRLEHISHDGVVPLPVIVREHMYYNIHICRHYLTQILHSV